MGHSDDVTCIAVHPDGRTVATGQSGKHPFLCVWDAATKDCEQISEIGALPVPKRELQRMSRVTEDGIEYFDMYSPLFSQLYSQVWWSGLAPTPFPQDIIERYAGRGMVIAGFEMDQVKRAKGCECPQGGACNENRTECATKDIPVPLTCAYNHHFESGIAGGKARFEKVKFTGEDDPRLLELLEERAASGMGGHRPPPPPRPQ